MYHEVRKLTYGQFVKKLVYVKRTRTWKPIKRGFTIGRLAWISQSTWDLQNYDSIKCIDEFQHQTFKYACIALGFLEDDREYIASIEEEDCWGSRFFFENCFSQCFWQVLSIDLGMYEPRQNIF